MWSQWTSTIKVGSDSRPSRTVYDSWIISVKRWFRHVLCNISLTVARWCFLLFECTGNVWWKVIERLLGLRSRAKGVVVWSRIKWGVPGSFYRWYLLRIRNCSNRKWNTHKNGGDSQLCREKFWLCSHEHKKIVKGQITLIRKKIFNSTAVVSINHCWLLHMAAFLDAFKTFANPGSSQERLGWSVHRPTRRGLLKSS